MFGVFCIGLSSRGGSKTSASRKCALRPQQKRLVAATDMYDAESDTADVAGAFRATVKIIDFE
jgi:hypothetical protein